MSVQSKSSSPVKGRQIFNEFHMAWKYKAEFKSESFPTLWLSTFPTATVQEQEDPGHGAESPQHPEVLTLLWEQSTTG